MKELWIKSTVDATMQPSLFRPARKEGRPLLVGLHTWSAQRQNQVSNLLPLAEAHDWNLLLPEFRGGNLKENPCCRDACGSIKAKQDIVDAVSYIEQNYAIDTQNILLLGASGGAHMALLMAGYAPLRWRAVGAFVPVVDLERWHEENPKYREGIEACCGGSPGDDTVQEYRERSPIYHASKIAKANIKIFAGKWDPIIPCHHSVDLYWRVFEEKPDARVFLEVFDGGHEMPLEMAERWLLSQLSSARRSLEQVTG